MSATAIALIIGGSSRDVTWAKYPYLDSLRRQCVAAVGGATPADAGAAVMALGARTECYNVCLQVDPVNAPVAASPGSLQDTVDAFSAYDLADTALQNLRALNVPYQYLDYLREYLTGSSPVYRLSAVASIITLAAIIFNSIPAL